MTETHIFYPATAYLRDAGLANIYVSTREHDALELMRKLLCDAEDCGGALWVRIYGHVIIRRHGTDNKWDFIPHERPIALGVSIDQIMAFILATNW